MLDVGGATGVYAGPLAAAGYQVRVIDPVPAHVADGRRPAGVTATVGDARSLPAADREADAVLLFGPLYHLLEGGDRVAAWREAARVVRPGGVVVGATINRFASFFDGFVKDYYLDPSFQPVVRGAPCPAACTAAKPFQRPISTTRTSRPQRRPRPASMCGAGWPSRVRCR